MLVGREKLCEEVWAEPMLAVTQRYRVSSSFLARICRRLRVPCHARDSWAKKAAGLKPKSPPLAQSGQYNLARSLRRGDFVAARTAEADFIRQAISMAHLLARRYRPFYKWMHRSLRTLSVLGPALHPLILKLVSQPRMSLDEATVSVEEICCRLIHELQAQNLTQSKEGSLLGHAQELQAQINESLYEFDPGLDWRNLSRNLMNQALKKGRIRGKNGRF
jgi:hypothetical protein